VLNTLKLRYYQGKQFIADPENAVLKDKFRGIPVLGQEKCNKCDKCISVCAAKAIKSDPLEIDLGKCVFCGDCQRACDQGAIKFTNAYKLGSTEREKLIVKSGRTAEDYIKDAVAAKKEIVRIFGRSLKLRQVSAGGCNGCEMELNACSNANFDMGRYGIDFVASPRHADGIVVTGVMNKNMARALDDTIKSVPEPKMIILVGSCAISGGVFQGSKELNRDILSKYKIDLYIPGCPVHPLTFIDAVRRYTESK
jgi:Ni,Fe-hydrogenase III small subunit/ferredoxin-like protein FixX